MRGATWGMHACTGHASKHIHCDGGVGGQGRCGKVSMTKGSYWQKGKESNRKQGQSKFRGLWGVCACSGHASTLVQCTGGGRGQGRCGEMSMTKGVTGIRSKASSGDCWACVHAPGMHQRSCTARRGQGRCGNVRSKAYAGRVKKDEQHVCSGHVSKHIRCTEGAEQAWRGGVCITGVSLPIHILRIYCSGILPPEALPTYHHSARCPDPSPPTHCAPFACRTPPRPTICA